MIRTEGQRLLQKYLKDTGKTQRDLARAIGRTEPTISVWMTGKNIPDTPGAVALEEYTRKAVPIRAWTIAPRQKQKAA